MKTKPSLFCLAAVLTLLPVGRAATNPQSAAHTVMQKTQITILYDAFGKASTKQTKAREGANVMLIIGCDFHPGFQQIAIFDNRTGELQEKRLRHRDEAEQFYAALPAPARVGMELVATPPTARRLLLA